jgi:hypothetical protein
MWSRTAEDLGGLNPWRAATDKSSCHCRFSFDSPEALEKIKAEKIWADKRS